MSFYLNRSKDITCDSLFLLDTNNILQNVLDLIANSGGSGGSGGITTLTGSGAAVITGTSTRKIYKLICQYFQLQMLLITC